LENPYSLKSENGHFGGYIGGLHEFYNIRIHTKWSMFRNVLIPMFIEAEVFGKHS
jgi:hypothetical protein